MRDILARLNYVNPRCTCLTKTPEHSYHDELCMYRVVHDAKAEIVRLRTRVEMLDEILASYPAIIAQTYHE